MDGAGQSLRHFWIKSNNGTFIAPQIKSFGPKNFKFHAQIKKCPFAQLIVASKVIKSQKFFHNSQFSTDPQPSLPHEFLKLIFETY